MAASQEGLKSIKLVSYAKICVCSGCVPMLASLGEEVLRRIETDKYYRLDK
jgi:hypothetical protein